MNTYYIHSIKVSDYAQRLAMIALLTKTHLIHSSRIALV